jgi:hypothetical protein
MLGGGGVKAFFKYLHGCLDLLRRHFLSGIAREARALKGEEGALDVGSTL